MDAHINIDVQSVAVLFWGKNEHVVGKGGDLPTVSWGDCKHSPLPLSDVLNSSCKVGFGMESENTSVRFLCFNNKVHYSVFHFKQLLYPLVNL